MPLLKCRMRKLDKYKKIMLSVSTFLREEEPIWYLMYKIFIQLKFKEEARKYKNIQPIIERKDEKSQVME